MILSRQRLNRTLLARQHLLERTSATPAEVIGHLLGLQAQEVLPPYLSLAARVQDFDPRAVTAGLESAELVRLGTLRATLHLHTATGAAGLRPWLQRMLESRVRVDADAVRAATAEALADGPADPRSLPAEARTVVPLVQLPPRGTWKGHGAIVLDHLARWTGVDGPAWDAAEVVRRYLRAFGPATAADVTTWSGVTGLRAVLGTMDDLVRHEDEAGRTLVDVPDGVLADEDAPAPVRLLGTYDNLWLGHAARDRVTTAESRTHWQGPNGASGATVFVDGWLSGLWRVREGRAEVVELLRALTPGERDDLDAELAGVQALLDA